MDTVLHVIFLCSMLMKINCVKIRYMISPLISYHTPVYCKTFFEVTETVLDADSDHQQFI